MTSSDVISFDDVPLLDEVRHALPYIFGEKADNLKVEGNYYYDITLRSQCGIGFHGDSERKIVVGVRVGASMTLRYRWYLRSEPISGNIDFILENGDIYAMSSKAVGTDWKKKRTIPTLRHAAGCKKFIGD